MKNYRLSGPGVYNKGNSATSYARSSASEKDGATDKKLRSYVAKSSSVKSDAADKGGRSYTTTSRSEKSEPPTQTRSVRKEEC